jgi:DNA-binding XRE family transcriptional regulator
MKEKKIRTLPRVIKIDKADKGLLSVVFNNGAHRSIDLRKLLKERGVSPSISRKLLNPVKGQGMEIVDGAISFPFVTQLISFRGKKMEVPFEIGADTLYELSIPDSNETTINIGELIQKERRKANLSQEELARRSGTSRTYISKIENNHAGLEVRTLQKVVETGLGKRLRISIK